MTDFFDGLEQDLVAAARRRRDEAARADAVTSRSAGLRRPGWRGGALASVVAVAVAGSAAAGTLLVLRGSPIPGPAERDAGPQQTPLAGSGRVLDIRSPDPDGGLPWTLRVARSKTGLACDTVGQRSGDDFGLVGLDGRFRVLQDGVVDGCSQGTLVGARIFEAKARKDVRTVLAGVAGADLRTVTVQAAGRTRRLATGADGSFVAAFRGYPEDVGLQVDLSFADGRVERHGLGRSPFLTPDPLGGAAWKVTASSGGVATQPGQRSRRPTALETCVQFSTARQTGAALTVSPPACGRLPLRAAGPGGKPGGPRHLRSFGYFLAIRRVVRVVPRRGQPVFAGQWTTHGPRTAVWGGIGDDVRDVVVTGPRGLREVLGRRPNGTVLLVLAPAVDPRTLTATVRFVDGRSRRVRGDANLRPAPRAR